MTPHRAVYLLRYHAWPAIKPWAPMAVVLAAGALVWWNVATQGGIVAARDAALRRAEAAEIHELRTHGFLIASTRRVDSLEKRVLTDSTNAQRWRDVAQDAAVHIERLVERRDALLDSLRIHPPLTLRDTAVAALREVHVLRQENAALHNEHDALIEAYGAQQLALNAARQQVAIFRAAVDSAVGRVDASVRAMGDLRRELARSDPPCTWIPFVQCLSRKSSAVLGMVVGAVGTAVILNARGA